MRPWGSNDTLGNRTRDLPACSAVPQAPPRAPCLHCMFFVCISEQRLFPYTAFTDWFSQPKRSVFCEVRTEYLSAIQVNLVSKGLINLFSWGGGQGAQRGLLTNRPEFTYTGATKNEFLLLLFQKLLIPDNGAHAHRLKQFDPAYHKRHRRSLPYKVNKAYKK